ncbi:hypothetical protein PAA8504_03093 [Palleronia abyssalis]|uniref:Uncharacterized protein n=1 Tax=Palleronia abyssalis TaxID=1501240 RepID=A0A2R8BYN6_9RHOB|nr:hypothetical protein PAA8504_03093 [Palleronia abyssalis]
MGFGVSRALLILLLGLGFCDTRPPEPAVGSLSTSDMAARCAEDGGAWGNVPKSGAQVCYRRPADGGQTCSSGADCDGDCLARSRTCAPVTPIFGCTEILTNSGTRVTRCID